MSLTFADIFCGAGGSSIGLSTAGANVAQWIGQQLATALGAAA